MYRFIVSMFIISLTCLSSHAYPTNQKYGQTDVFRQLDELLPTPNSFRTASGAPGSEYWQQKVDYVIDVEIDDQRQHLIGSETITYHNRSPHTLNYIWIQLDANIYRPDSDNRLTETAPEFDMVSISHLRMMISKNKFDGSAHITSVRDGAGNDLDYTIVKTMMRVDLPRPLQPGKTFTLAIDWNYKINEFKYVRGRTGCEYFKEDDNYLYEIAQWYPRVVAYTDYAGWQNKQFLGRGEFTLEFGDYEVNITVPEDHAVAATGILQNPRDVLTSTQRERLKKAETAEKPVFIITPDEALANQANKAEGKKTWKFKAENVRDYAFATSRKFIWDAQGHQNGGRTVMCMSFYPNEGEPLWSCYSTHAIMHTLDVYSSFTFDYPYPVAISVNGPVYGMEYPMICFNGPRPQKDGTYSERTKYGLISVIIHEVGHNYFPMIVNSDERQWTWIDEGINSFLQYLSEQEWEDDYPSRRGDPRKITDYMTSSNQVPIMTNSESILQFGNNAYAKPATALNILRETILGRELFDYAFREFAQRWMFKRPEPADLFRTLEDASGIDLDWFIRGWFYTTDHVDISIDKVYLYEMESKNPEVAKLARKKEHAEEPESISEIRNKPLPKRVERYPELLDFYNEFDEFEVTEEDLKEYQKFLDSLEDDDKDYIQTPYNFYVVEFSNMGGLVMPIILEIHYDDKSSELVRIPAEIWRHNNQKVKKLILSTKTIESLVLDPYFETADTERHNNTFPREIIESRFQIKKEKEPENPMQKSQKANDKNDQNQGGEDKINE